MKKIFLSILFLATPGLVFGFNGHQGFKKFEEKNTGVSASCEKQCFIVLNKLNSNDKIKISGNFSGNGKFGYGFLVGQQIIPGKILKINGSSKIKNQFIFSKNPYYSQIPKNSNLILIFDGGISSNSLRFSLIKSSVFEKIKNGFLQALEYKEYNPRTINFLEGPIWNGKYINETFFWWIILLLIIAFVWYFINDNEKNKKSIYFGALVLVFFWVFFDFFSTINQYKIFRDVKLSGNIMQNGRVGKNSDFYPFLNFIKNNIPSKSKGFFIAPYPFNFEGKYHIYPEVKFDKIEKVKYIFWYNPYGKNSPFNFKDPVFDSGTLIRDKKTFKIKDEIKWKDYAKIFIVR